MLTYVPVCKHTWYRFRVICAWQQSDGLIHKEWLYDGPGWGIAVTVANHARTNKAYLEVIIEAQCVGCREWRVFEWPGRGATTWVLRPHPPAPAPTLNAAAPQPANIFDELEAEARELREAVTGCN